jgi:hypothetical protein
MAEAIIAESTRVGDPIFARGKREAETREERALLLFAEHGHLIEWLSGDIYLCPSGDGARMYRVQYGGEYEFCNCEDHNYHPERACKHLLAVAVAHSKRRKRRLNFISSLLAGEEVSQ